MEDMDMELYLSQSKKLVDHCLDGLLPPERQQVLRFEAALRREGLAASVVTTPRDVSLGCGLSVRFEIEDFAAVKRVYRELRPTNLIGFYRIDRLDGNRLTTTPMA